MGLVGWWREHMKDRRELGDEWKWWHIIPYAWLLTPSWWRYVLGPTRGYSSDYRIVDRWRTAVCRWRGHPAGVWWFNPCACEPDMHCKNCGDNLG